MGKFLTTASRTEQVPQKGVYKLIDNELYKDDDESINLHWRNFRTDNYTYIKKGDWDIRCAHGHDIACKYHQIVKVIFSEKELKEKGFLHEYKGLMICEDIPPCFLRIEDITGHETNNLLYRMMRDADCPKTPKFYQYIYRAGVSFNLNWFFTGKQKIEIGNLYNDEWNK